MLGQVDYWSPLRIGARGIATKGYGFLVVHHDDNHIEKYFALGSRLLFESRPVPGQWVTFDVSDEQPRREYGYKLAVNIRLAEPPTTEPAVGCEFDAGGVK